MRAPVGVGTLTRIAARVCSFHSRAAEGAARTVGTKKKTAKTDMVIGFRSTMMRDDLFIGEISREGERSGIESGLQELRGGRVLKNTSNEWLIRVGIPISSSPLRSPSHGVPELPVDWHHEVPGVLESVLIIGFRSPLSVFQKP